MSFNYINVETIGKFGNVKIKINLEKKYTTPANEFFLLKKKHFYSKTILYLYLKALL